MEAHITTRISPVNHQEQHLRAIHLQITFPPCDIAETGPSPEINHHHHQQATTINSKGMSDSALLPYPESTLIFINTSLWQIVVPHKGVGRGVVHIMQAEALLLRLQFLWILIQFGGG